MWRKDLYVIAVLALEAIIVYEGVGERQSGGIVSKSQNAQNSLYVEKIYCNQKKQLSFQNTCT